MQARLTVLCSMFVVYSCPVAFLRAVPPLGIRILGYAISVVPRLIMSLHDSLFEWDYTERPSTVSVGHSPDHCDLRGGT